VSAQLVRRTDEDGWADEAREVRLSSVVPIRSRGEAKPVGSHRSFGRAPIGRCRQVVDLVKDEQAEAIELACVDRRRVIGHDGERRDLLLAAAERADVLGRRAELLD
jgi:hypothetical protein